MNGFVQVPSKGQPMTAQWGADVANGLNAIRSAGQSGMLLTDGPTGTGFAPLPANLRDRRGGSEANHQLFTLRSFVEKNENGKSRLAVEWYEIENIPKFRWNTFNPFPSRPGIGGPSPRWERAFTGDWCDDVADIDEDVYVYLNINLDVEVDWNGAAVIKPNPDCGANVSTTPIEETYNIHTPNTLLLRTANLIGSVKARGTSIKVTQIFTGPLMFADFILEGGGDGGSGSEGDIYGTNYPMPFQYKRTETEDQETGETTYSCEIVNNTFYWDGVLKSLSDFTPPATCTVYLCCTQDAPSSSHPDPDWEFEIATSESEAPSGGRAVNYKLYDIENNAVTMDYRTTFVEFKSPHEKAEVVVKRPGSSGSNPVVRISAYQDNRAAVNVDAGGTLTYAKTEVTDTSSKHTLSSGANTFVIAEASALNTHLQIKRGIKSIILSAQKLDFAKGNIEFHTLTVKDADGGEEKFVVLADSDIEIFRAKGTVLKDVELKYENYSLQMKKTTIDLATGNETGGEYKTVFETEPHSAQ